MDEFEEAPVYDSVADVAGCTNDGLVYAAFTRENKVHLWVHSGVQEKWHWLAALQLPSQPYPSDLRCPMSSALTHDKSCVDVFLEVPGSTASAYLFRFFIFNPNENCVYACIDAEKIQFRGYNIEPVLARLGADCLLVAGIQMPDARFHIWCINLDEASMAFALTSVLAFDTESGLGLATFCADEDFLYVCDSPRGKIKVYEKSHDDSVVQLCQEVVFPISQTDGYYPFRDVCTYPSSCGRLLVMPAEYFCCIFDCNLLSLRKIWSLPGFSPYNTLWISQKVCTASSAQFFWLQMHDGMIAQKRINVPSLQYACLRKLCEIWPALKTCTGEKEAKEMGISHPVWNRFFKPLVKAEAL